MTDSQQDAIKNNIEGLLEYMAQPRLLERVSFLGYNIVISEGVFPVGPEAQPFTREAELLQLLNDARDGEQVLDMGSGSGIHSVVAKKKGAIVTAVDCNPNAVALTYHNLNIDRDYYGLPIMTKKPAKVYQGDVWTINQKIPPGTVSWDFQFQKIHPGERLHTYDLIIANLPYTNAPLPTGAEYEHAMFDPGYKTHEKFFDGVRKHLKDNGRILFAHGSAGNLDEVRQLWQQAGLHATQSMTLRDEKTEYEWYAMRLEVTKNHAVKRDTCPPH
jgi:release factor glutamine methyltransferase